MTKVLNFENSLVMKKYYKIIPLILIFSYQNQSLHAQDFAPIGSIWYYSYYDEYNSSNRGYYKIESLKDTTIQEHNCKKLSITRYSSYSGYANLIDYEYVYTVGDIVYRLAKNDVFYVLYNWGAQIGDTWTVRSRTFISEGIELEAEIEVRNIRNVEINGEPLRQLEVSSDNIELSFAWGENNLITEKIGSVNYLFPQSHNMVDLVGIIGPLRCYQDNVFGLYNNTSGETCDAIFTSTEKTTKEDNFLISPNPTTNNISIKRSMQESKRLQVSIYTIQGQLVEKKEFRESEKNLEIDLPQKGTYFLIIQSEDGVRWIKKVVKL